MFQKINAIKKMALIAALSLFVGAAAFSQVVIDPNLDFYESARQWQIKGYVGFLPQISPYPASVIKEILDAVIEKGTDADVETAQYYYEKYFSKQWHVGFEVGASLKASDKGSNKLTKFVFAEPSVYGDVLLKDWIALGYNLGLNLHNKSTESSEILRTFQNETLNTWGDAATFGPLDGNWDMEAGLNVGNATINGIVGANRIGFSNIFGHDNIVVNPLSCHMNNLLVNYSSEKWQYSQTISAIAAANYRGGGSKIEFTANKFLAFHSVRFTPIKQLSISYFEAGIVGGRFDPSYLIPAPYILLQGMFDAGDNDIYGLLFEYRPFDRFEAAFAFAIDDISIDDWAKGNFDSKFKAALQAGVMYTPSTDFCKKIALDYTLVLPYMYSHWINSPDKDTGPLPGGAETFNYSNYTNHGVSIGSNLMPNSDRVHFEAHFEPLKRLNLNVFTDFMRHANETESWNNEEVVAHCIKFAEHDNTGGAGTDPYPKTVQERMTFLSQEHKMYAFQLGLKASWEAFRRSYGTLSLNLGYTFEFIYNKGVDTAIYTSEAAGAINTATDKAAAIDAAKKTWADKLYNEVNNYITLSAKYSY